MKRTLIVLALGSALLALAAVFQLGSDAAPHSALPPAASADDPVSAAVPLPAPRQAVVAPAPALPVPAQPARAVAAVPVPAPAAPPAAGEPPPQPEPPLPPNYDPTYEAFIEAQFEADVPDTEWNDGPQLQPKITRALPPGSVGEPVECRRKLCRLRSVHLNTESYQQFLHNGIDTDDAERKLWDGPQLLGKPFSATGATSGYSIVSVIYFGREDAMPSR